MTRRDCRLTSRRAVWRRRWQVRRTNRARRGRADGVHAACADRLRRAVLLLHHPDHAGRAAKRSDRRRARRGRARGRRRLQGNRADRRAPRLVRPRSVSRRLGLVESARATRAVVRGASGPPASASARSSRWTARPRSSIWSQTCDRFAPHFHLPLQHASDRVLAAMRRPYTIEYYAALVDDIRARIPDASIGSDIIVGFPGETDEDFEQLVRLSRALAADAHSRVPVFRSARHARRRRWRTRCPERVIRERARRVRDIGRTSDRRVSATRRSGRLTGR